MDTIVLIKKNGDKFEYIINGNKIEKTLSYFSEMVLKEGRDSIVDIYFSDAIPFGIVSNLRGIILKAGIKDVRFLYFNKNTLKAIELQYSGAVFPIPKIITNN